MPGRVQGLFSAGRVEALFASQCEWVIHEGLGRVEAPVLATHLTHLRSGIPRILWPCPGDSASPAQIRQQHGPHPDSVSCRRSSGEQTVYEDAEDEMPLRSSCSVVLAVQTHHR